MNNKTISPITDAIWKKFEIRAQKIKEQFRQENELHRPSYELLHKHFTI